MPDAWMHTAAQWGGTFLQCAGAAGMASRLAKPVLAYLVMLLGAYLWLILAISQNNWPLTVMQGFFVLLNAIGIVRWMK